MKDLFISYIWSNKGNSGHGSVQCTCQKPVNYEVIKELQKQVEEQKNIEAVVILYWCRMEE